jgi:hypothetical protein
VCFCFLSDTFWVAVSCITTGFGLVETLIIKTVRLISFDSERKTDHTGSNYDSSATLPLDLIISIYDRFDRLFYVRIRIIQYSTLHFTLLCYDDSPSYLSPSPPIFLTLYSHRRCRSSLHMHSPSFDRLFVTSPSFCNLDCLKVLAWMGFLVSTAYLIPTFEPYWIDFTRRQQQVQMFPPMLTS